MRATWAMWALTVVLLGAVVGCPKKKTDAGDAAADAEVAVFDAAPPAPEAANFAEVARFGDETKIDNQTAKLEVSVTTVHKSPPNGDQVARLLKGTEVVKIAQHKDAQILITFANPKKPDERLMGWVAGSSFTVPPPFKGPGACKTDKDCKAPAQCAHAAEGFRCVTKCDDTAAGACAKGQECTGNAVLEGGLFRFCAPNRDAGAATGDGGGTKTDGGK